MGLAAGAAQGAISPVSSLGTPSYGALTAAAAAAQTGRDDGYLSGTAHTSIEEREGGNDGYEKRLDPLGGDIVYLDTKTGAATRTRPVFFSTPRLDDDTMGATPMGKSRGAAPGQPTPDLKPLEPGAGGWLKYLDEASGAVYYFHPETGATQWERPMEYYTPRDQDGKAGVPVPNPAVSATTHGVGWGDGGGDQG